MGLSAFLQKFNTISCSPADLLFFQFDEEKGLCAELVKEYMSAKSEEKEYTVDVDNSFAVTDGIGQLGCALHSTCKAVTVNWTGADHNAEGCDYTKTEEMLAAEKEMLDKANAPLHIVLWGSCADEAEDVAKLLEEYGKVESCAQYYPDEVTCYEICRSMIDAADLYGNKHNAKVTVKNPRLAVIKLKLNSPVFTTADNDEIKLARKLISYRIPLIAQTAQIRQKITDRTFIKDSQLFIPQNFYQNSEFAQLLAQLEE